MIRTVVSVLITLLLIFGLSFYEAYYVNTVFDFFHETLEALYQKAESGTATYEDGTAVRTYWNKKRERLHVWLPHTALQEVDYQLNEAIGYLYVKDYQNAVPKIEVLLTLSKTIPGSYSFGVENIF